MNIIIIEDEALAAERLEKLIHQVDTSIQILAVLGSVEEAIEWLSAHPAPDLGFFDIELSDGTCFDIADTLVIDFPVIFTTSYDQYAIDAFSVKSIDYLLKPVRMERLSKAIEKYRSWQCPVQLEITELRTLIRTELNQGSATFKNRWLVKNGTLIQAVATDQIAYFYSEQKMTLLVTREGKRFPLDHSLDKVMSLLDPTLFFRLNRKYIVHIESPSKMHPYFKGRLKVELSPPMQDDIVVSSDRTPEFKAWLDR